MFTTDHKVTRARVWRFLSNINRVTTARVKRHLLALPTDLLRISSNCTSLLMSPLNRRPSFVCHMWPLCIRPSWYRVSYPYAMNWWETKSVVCLWYTKSPLTANIIWELISGLAPGPQAQGALGTWQTNYKLNYWKLLSNSVPFNYN